MKVTTYPLSQQQARKDSVDTDLRPDSDGKTLHQLQLGSLGDSIRHAGAPLANRLSHDVNKSHISRYSNKGESLQLSSL